MREIRRMLVETVIVAVVSLGIGLGANAINEDGLKLSKNYFERPRPVPAPPVPPASRESPAAGSTQAAADPAQAPANAAAQRLQAAGIGIAHIHDVKEMLASPLFGSTHFLIDARDDEHYQDGHISGAYQLDHYRADRYLPTLLPLLLPAEKIILYCNGGECEDSELAAMDLIQQGISHSRISVYLEGYQEWVSRQELVEKGERGSGNIVPGTAP